MIKQISNSKKGIEVIIYEQSNIMWKMCKGSRIEK